MVSSMSSMARWRSSDGCRFKYGSIDGSVELALEPLHGILLADPLGGTQARAATLPQADASASTSQHDVEVHTEDTGVGVVLHAQIDVLLNSEAEVSGVREVLLLELLVADLEAPIEDFLSLIAADGHVHGHLLVTLDAEASDGEASARVHGLLA
jgi:hypothetical protein